ncbi:MAG: energy-coupling factor transporter transmembrane component T [Corynebacterium sp.]|nr:energy-coupling factor transporter transmembrane component T [Corynebacterium sp.]
MNLIAGINPAVRLAMMVVWTTPLLLSVDWVSASISLVLTVLLAPLCGMNWLRLTKVAWPLFLIAPLSGLSMLLYGRPGGEEYFSFWLATVTDNSIELAIGMTVRVLAVALPVIVLARDIDPTELGDALAQVVRLPARFVIGAMAGARMAMLFRNDWESLARARRARGLGDRNKIAHLLSMSFGILVMAIRRGGKLATAMEARGFGRTKGRTWARESRLSIRDGWVLLATCFLTAVPVVTSIATGWWRFLGL